MTYWEFVRAIMKLMEENVAARIALYVAVSIAGLCLIAIGVNSGIAFWTWFGALCLVSVPLNIAAFYYRNTH